MSNYSFLWDTSWTATSIAASSVTSPGGTATTAAIDNQGKFSTLVSIQASWSGTPTTGLDVYILGDLDGTNYQTTTDNTIAVRLPSTTSPATTTITVLGSMQRRFKVSVVNNTGVSMTVTVDYLQSVVQQV